MEEQTQSPIPRTNNEATGTFSEAIEWVMTGCHITKLEWGTQEVYGVLKNGILMLHKEDGKDYQWIISQGDLEGKDWIKLPVMLDYE